MLQKNLLYTGITRGKRLVVLVGQKKANRDRSSQRFGRWSKLDEWLQLGASRASFDTPRAGRGRP
jgi:exodeoxyribonuclease V alpha subunit